jgi:general secretion pathway protein K
MRCRGTDGFALVAVLWILVVVGVVGVTFQVGARAERRAAANMRAESRGRWAGRAGLALVLSQIDNTVHQSGLAFGLRAAGDTVLSPIEFVSGDVLVSAVALDARARLNLNVASHRQLTALAGAVGLSAEEAVVLAASILDWRDADDLRRARGAEARDYAAMQPPARPKNALFQTVDELLTVRGVTPAVYARIAPYVTTAGDGRVNLNAAPLPVLLTVSGIDRAATAAILARRRAGPFRNQFEVLESLPRRARDRIRENLGAFADAIAFSPRDLEIRVRAAGPGSPLVTETRALVRLEGGSAWTLTQVVGQ